MARPASQITLTEKQKNILKTISSSRTAPAHHQERANIILLCAQGDTNASIMKELNLNKKTISKWRTRWSRKQLQLLQNESKENSITFQRIIESMLDDAPRSGKPPKFTAEQICQIISVACETPEENNLPFSHWSLSLLVETLVKRGIVSSISTSQLNVFLK
tara:strand:- start:785 stop:1270 length:486 start_codon:yes stop_codon:yes gene_type:complete